MKIILLRSSSLTGDSRVAKETLALLSAGHEITLLGWDRSSTYKAKEQKIEFLGEKVPSYTIGVKAGVDIGFQKNLWPMIKYQLVLLRWLLKNKKKYDCIHACDLDTGISAVVCKCLLRKKLVYDIFDYYADSHRLPAKVDGMARKLENSIISKADATIICTEQRKGQIAGAHPQNLFIIHNSPDSRFLINRNVQLSGSRVKIVYVGAFIQNRLIQELVETVSSRNDCELHIGGCGEKALEWFVKNAADQFENIYFYGKMDYSDVLALENGCDVMVALYNPEIKNHYYAAPNKFYEALLLGKPLIMVKNTGMDEVVEQNGFGTVVEYNQKSLDEGISRLISHKSEWPNMAEEMRCLYMKKYSWETMQERLVQLYDMI